MKCERCAGVMREEQFVVSEGTVKIKGVSAWHCLDCGRIEYRTTVTHHLILDEVDRHAVQRAARESVDRTIVSPMA
jgi:hypothetical protein